MTRMSKQGRKRHVSPRKPRLASAKTGSKKCNLPLGYKEHVNMAPTGAAPARFIPKT